MTTSNPFEPPRTSDLEGGSSGPGALVFSEAALQELAASAGWVRWFARFTAVSMIVGIVEAGATMFGSTVRGSTVSAMFSAIIGTAISLMFLAILYRYARAAERVRSGERFSAIEVVDAQRAYFKLAGIMTIIGIALIVLVFFIGLSLGGSRMMG
jgi:hypothetical protein